MITEKEIKSWLDCIGVPEECKRLLEQLLEERDAYREICIRFVAHDQDTPLLDGVAKRVDAEAAWITKEREGV